MKGKGSRQLSKSDMMNVMFHRSKAMGEEIIRQGEILEQLLESLHTITALVLSTEDERAIIAEELKDGGDNNTSDSEHISSNMEPEAHSGDQGTEGVSGS
jgi:hypothetical protein